MTKKSWGKGLRYALTQAAETVTGGAKSAVDYGVDSARSALSTAEKEMLRAYYATTDTVLGAVRGARNAAADVVRHGGALAGAAGGIAGEVSLIMAGGFPFLVLGGLPSSLGHAFAQQCAKASISFRGTEPQFIGVRQEEAMMKIFGAEDRVFAVMYDPNYIFADEAGFAQLDEENLARRGAFFANDRRSKATFTAALIAVQETKLKIGLALHLPNVSQSIETGVTLKPKP